MTDSEIEDLIAGRRPELAYLLNESELQGFLRGDCYIVDCLRRPSILRDCGAAPNDGLSSGIIGLDIGGNCPMRGGIAWCRQGRRVRWIMKVACALGYRWGTPRNDVTATDATEPVL